ncbi:hypothetical protein TYRP_023107 [Tyrophagus putrescentiae]|nr:hypothetical protein TYRP_023107 [Tyrophagus putrescentiae]
MTTAVTKFLLNPIGDHLLDLVYYLDPLASEHSANRDDRQKQSFSSSSWNITFLGPVLAIIVSFAYGNIFMFYSEESCSASGGQWTLSLEALKRCPGLMYHQTFPRPIWTQIDISFSIAATCYATVFATFLQKGHPFPCRYVVDKKQPRIILSFRGKRLSPDISAAILLYHRRFQAFFAFYFTFTFVFVLTFNLVHVLLINAVYTVSLRNGLLILLFFPLHLFYTMYTSFYMMHFPLMDSQFLCIRQQALSKSLNKLLQYSSNRVGDDFDITIQSYMAYITFFVNDIPLNSLVMFAYAAVFMEIIIFMLVFFCCKVAQCSGALERANAQFCMAFLQKGGFKNFPKGLILKAEWLQSAHRLRPYCMVLLDNYRITSKTFYLVISNTALFFLMVFKNNYRY